MKTNDILSFQMDGKKFFVIASVGIAIVRFETESGLRFDPTGLQSDKFGLSYIRGNYPENRLFDSLAKLKKHVNFLKRCGVNDLTVNFSGVC